MFHEVNHDLVSFSLVVVPSPGMSPRHHRIWLLLPSAGRGAQFVFNFCSHPLGGWGVLG